MLGPPDARLASVVLVVPALVWLALEVSSPYEHYPTGDYAAIELYTRQAADGAQRVGAYSRFHFHHPGPAFFYAAAPIYTLLGGTSRALGIAAVVWNLLALVALIRCTSRLAPGTGPFVAASLLAVFLGFRGLGWLLSPWNPHLAILPFGVALLASARLATGEGRTLTMMVLAGGLAVQCHILCAGPVALIGAAGLLAAVWPSVRRRLGIPAVGAGIGRAALLAALLTAAVLWALPLHDELVGGYGNLQRIVTLQGQAASRPARPWLEATEIAGRAFVSFAADPLRETDRKANSQRSGDTRPAAAGLLLVGVALAGVLAARRSSPMVAVAVMTVLGAAATVFVVRASPGRVFPEYLIRWGGLVGIAGAAVIGTECLARVSRLRAAALGRPGRVVLVLLPVLLLANSARSYWEGGGTHRRSPQSRRVERMSLAVQESVSAEKAGPLLVRVSPAADQSTVVGLLLALDKAGLAFTVEPFGPYRLMGRFAPRGDEAAELLLGDVPPGPRAMRVSDDAFGIVWQQRTRSIRER